MDSEKKGFVVVFDGLHGSEDDKTPLTVNVRELRHLLETGAVKIQARYIRSALVAQVAGTYAPEATRDEIMGQA